MPSATRRLSLCLNRLGKRLPKLADYSRLVPSPLRSSRLKNYRKVPATLEVVWKQKPPSPWPRVPASLPSTSVRRQSSAPNNAVDILRKNCRASAATGRAIWLWRPLSGLLGDAVSAAIYSQRVYYSRSNLDGSQRGGERRSLD